jgi:hypothetical protein
MESGRERFVTAVRGDGEAGWPRTLRREFDRKGQEAGILVICHVMDAQ